MALDFTTFFTHQGKVIKSVNALGSIGGTTLPAQLAEIVAAYGTADTGIGTGQSPIEGINAQYLTLINQVDNVRRAIAAYATSTFLDYDTVIAQLPVLQDAAISDVEVAFFNEMVAQAQTVTRSFVTLGTATASSFNTGNGTILLDKGLDGYNSPLGGSVPIPGYAGLDSELHPPTATHVFVCVADSYGGGTLQGSEVFSWSASFDFGQLSSISETPGPGPNLTCASGISIVDGDFDFFNGDVPAGWEVAQGTEGVNVLQSADANRGDFAVELVSTGEPVSIEYPVQLDPLRRYCAMFYAKNNKGSASTSSALNLSLSGTGYDLTPVTAALSGMSYTDYTLYYAFFNAPANPPSNLVVSIQLDAGDGDVLVDNVAIAPATYWSGICAVAVTGGTPWVYGDRINFSATTNSEGVIQQFYRRWFLMQLPSTATGPIIDDGLGTYLLLTTTVTPTISDSLAT